MAEIKIGNKLVGDGHPTFVVAEIGNNHNGDINLARKLMDKAKEFKVDAVKFQVKNIEKAFPQKLLDTPYENHNSFGKTYREHKEFLEFSHDQYKELQQYAVSQDIIFFATPFDIDSLQFLIEIEVPAIKIASFHLTNDELLSQAANFGKPVLLSTGMSTLGEVDHACEILKSKKAPFALLQCISCYPTEDEDVHLSVIREYKNRYNVVAGYSGHERGISIAASSIFFGASIIEKHFTLDRTMRGPDHAASLELKGMSGLVERVRLLEKSIGIPQKQLLDCELTNRRKNRNGIQKCMI